jgi:hypothetical protein
MRSPPFTQLCCLSFAPDAWAWLIPNIGSYLGRHFEEVRNHSSSCGVGRTCIVGLSDSSTRTPVSPFSGPTKWILHENDFGALATARASSRSRRRELDLRIVTWKAGDPNRRRIGSQSAKPGHNLICERLQRLHYELVRDRCHLHHQNQFIDTCRLKPYDCFYRGCRISDHRRQ